jgi:hypothetical protein
MRREVVMQGREEREQGSGNEEPAVVEAAADHQSTGGGQRFSSQGPIPAPSLAEHAPGPTASDRAYGEHGAGATINGPTHLRVTAPSGLNVRSSTSSKGHANIVGGLHMGEELDGVEQVGEWIRISFKGGEAYVHSGYVEVAPVKAPPVTAAPHHDPAAPKLEHPAVAHVIEDTHAKVAKADAPPPTFHAAPHPAAAPAAPAVDTQAELHAEMTSIIAAFDAGLIDQEAGMKQFVHFDMQHNNGMPSASGMSLMTSLASTLGQHAADRMKKGQPVPVPVQHDTATTEKHDETKAAAVAPHADDKTFTTLTGNEIAATTHEEAHVLNDIRFREERLDPVWLATAQTTLGVVDKTGAMNTETLRAMRTKAGNPALGAAGVLDKKFLATLAPGEPFMPATDGLLHGKEREAPNEKATTPADHAAQRAGYKDYASYHSTFEKITFLGQSAKQGKSSGLGTHHLANRLRAAEAFLEAKYGAKGDECVKKMGWNGAIGAAYEDHAETGMSHPHTMGIAIDIDAGQNPWIFNDASAGSFWKGWFEESFARATRIFGGEGITAHSMWKMSEQMSTEELWQHINRTSDSFRKYMELGAKGNSDEHIIEVMVQGGKYTREEAQADLPKVRGANGTFHGKDADHSFGRHYATSITNIKEDLVVALRDVAGLAWGGTEMHGAINGDFMHFDCRYDVLGQTVLPAGLHRYDESEEHGGHKKK